MIEMKPHTHKWKCKKTKQGVLRSCRCGERILDVAVQKASSLDGEYKELRVKGKHRKK